MTLGPAIIALALFERIANSLRRPFVTLGCVPLFYYLLHLTLIHAVAVTFAYVRYGQATWMFKNPSLPVSTAILPYPEGYGYRLAVVYAIWIGVVLLLYPACRWFAKVKSRRRETWLSYL